ncbi:hypothetical protein J6590_044395, partial [Homalodisca vitripennis]
MKRIIFVGVILQLFTADLARPISERPLWYLVKTGKDMQGYQQHVLYVYAVETKANRRKLERTVNYISPTLSEEILLVTPPSSLQLPKAR